MNYTLLDREQARKLYHSPSAIRHCKAIILESEKLRQFKKEVSDFNNLQEMVNSPIIKKEIHKIFRLIRFDVPLASDHQVSTSS